MIVAELDRAELAEIAALLDRACAYDRAGVVAEQLVFGPAPKLVDNRQVGELHPRAFGVRDGARLVGAAATCGSRIRVLAVDPCARRGGIGAALLDACCAAIRGDGFPKARTLDQPGNYLAPGIDVANRMTIGWLERRGFVRLPDERANVRIAVRGNPRVSEARATETAEAARAKGFEVRRARRDETALLDAVAAEFGGAWPFELARALEHDPPGVHVALRDGAYCAFAAHDGNNRGLGWFGPTGTWPEQRGNGLGEALLLACLVDVAAHHAFCEVAWIGPRPFYDKVAGVAEDRAFVVLTKEL